MLEFTQIEWMIIVLMQYIGLQELHVIQYTDQGNRKAMNMNWCKQKANPALKTKTGNK